MQRSCFCDKIQGLVLTVFLWYWKKSKYLSDCYFVDFKLIKQCLDYHFHFLLFVEINVSTALFSRNDVEVIYFCPRTFTHYQKLFDSRKKFFFFIHHFRTKFVIRNEKPFVLCFSCFNECSQIFKIHENFETVRQCFLRYFIEEESK